MNIIKLRCIPTFRILDYEKGVEFYIDFLGFSIDWEHRFGPSEPVYMQVSRNNLTLHLSENNRFQTEVIIFVDTEGIEANTSIACEVVVTHGGRRSTIALH